MSIQDDIRNKRVINIDQEEAVAKTIKQGDIVTTVIDNDIRVGSVEKDSHGYWIVPEGAHEHTYHTPVVNLKAINGKPIQNGQP